MYRPPSRSRISGTVLKSEYDSCRNALQEIVDESLEKGNCFTLVMDGWSNIRRRSIYGMLLCNPHVYPVVNDICDASSRPSTGSELLSLVRDSLNKWMTQYHGIDAVVTDNASNMRLMKEYLEEETGDIGTSSNSSATLEPADNVGETEGSSNNAESPSSEPQTTSEIVIVPCFAHVLNLLLKSILSHSRCRSVLKNANDVVSYFKNNSYWSWRSSTMSVILCSFT